MTKRMNREERAELRKGMTKMRRGSADCCMSATDFRRVSNKMLDVEKIYGSKVVNRRAL